MSQPSPDTPALTCTPKFLPHALLDDAAQRAIEENPTNRPDVGAIARILPESAPMKGFISVLTSKYWRTNGVRLTVDFMDNPPNDLRAKILGHMNAWGTRCNVLFTESKTDPQVRISRAKGGYWSYLGTDILSITHDQQTMNLEGFTMNTPDSEFYRVVRHETGHTLGCPHEHMRADIVNLIDPAKAIAFFGQTQGWSADQVRAQVLTPLDPKSVWGTVSSDRQSIMCYQLPGTITKDGKPILGGLDIDQLDYDFMAKVYPKAVATHDAASLAAAMSAPAAHLHHPSCPGCIDVTLRGGARLSIPPETTEAQLRTVLCALAD